MYDHDYYAAMDHKMIQTLKDVAWMMGLGALALMCYIILQPLRLFEFICGTVKTGHNAQTEQSIRFENLKRYGHI